MANNRDVQLTIRARDQATKAIESVADALRVLENAGADSGAGVAALTKSLSVLESANKRLAASAETLNRNLERQKAAAQADAAALEQRKTRVAELTVELKRLQAEQAKAAKGPTRDGLTENIKNLRVELRAAQADVRKLPQSITGNNDAAARSTEALRALAEEQARVADASARATAQIELQAQAQRQATEAARQQAAAQQFFNNRFAPGLSRPGNTSAQQQEIAAVLRVAEARDRELQGYRQEAAAVAQAERAQRSYNAILDKRVGKSAAESARLFRESAEAAEQEAVALQRLRAQINPVAVAEARVTEEVRKLVQWRRQGKITLDEARQALALYRAELERVRNEEGRRPGQPNPLDTRGRPTILGLKPYELQNLGFQVNDIVTQLASGTSLSQTLAQQMGQIFQILPGIGARFLAFITSPILVAGAALGGVFIAGLVRAGNEAERLRTVQSIIASIGNAAGTSATQVNQAAADLDRFGLSAEDAISSIRIFTRAALNPERFVQFGLAARDMALVLGKDVPDAAKLLADGLTGGFEAVQRLQEETGVYTEAELERIKVLFESGKAEEARRVATEAATRSYQEAADKARGPWARAALAFEDSWDRLISTLANSTGITTVVNLVGGLVEKVELLIRAGNTLTASEFFKWLAGGAVSVFTGTQNPFRVPDAPRPGAGTGEVVDPARVGAADARLLNETRASVLADTEVRSRAILEEKLVQFRKQIEREISQNNPTASPAARAEAVNLRVAQERVKLEKQLTDYQEQQANAAERKKKEAAEAAKKAREPIDAQEDLNARLDREAATRQRIAANERAKFGLVGESLIAEERRQAIAEAVRAEEERLVELNRNRVQEGNAALVLDQQRLNAIRDAAAAEFDARNAARAANEQRRQIDEPVQELTALRDSIMQRMTQLTQQGQDSAAALLRDDLIAVNGQLDQATQKAIEFYRALTPGDNPFGLTATEIDTIVQKLELGKTRLQEFNVIAGITTTQIAQTFASTATGAIDQFAQAVAGGENAFKSLGDAFRNFAANFLRQIAQMIIQALIFRALLSIFAGLFDFGASSSAGFISSNSAAGLTVAHKGGIIGGKGPTIRTGVNPGVFANATRYHTGGIAGLRPNEVPAILERGEEVLTADDPRHRANGGGQTPVTVINALDASDVMSKALSTRPGEQALLNFIRVNNTAVKSALG